MKLRYKLILAMLIVAAAPIGIAGYQALGLSRSAVEERIREILAKTSRAEAEIIGRDIADIIGALHLVAGTMEADPESLSNLSRSLSRVYLLSDRFNAAALFDPAGRQVGPTIFVDDRSSFSSEYQGHEEVNAEELDAFLKQVHQVALGSAKTTQSAVYVSARKRVPLTAVFIPVSGPENQRLTLAVELSLGILQKRFEQFRVGKDGFAFLVDHQGRLVFHSDLQRALVREDLSSLPILKGRLGTGNAAVSDYPDPGLGDMVGAFAPVAGTMWAVVVAQPKNEALEPSRRLGGRLISWLLLGLSLAGFIGLFLAGRITRPIQDLVQGALAIASGRLGHKIHVQGRDEIGKLGNTFNHMGSELQKHRAKIEAQTEEIKRWNLELQNRVEERTRELKEAQQQLIHAQKMAAVGELGAGVAHEVNNPLMGVLGSAQLLLMRHPKDDADHDMLSDIERDAQRIRSIVSRLLEVSQTGTDGMNRVSLVNLVTQVVSQLENGLNQKGIRIEAKVPQDLPPILGHSSQLEQVFSELLVNASHAMPGGGLIRVSGSGTEGEVVKLEVADNGSGIAPEHLGRIFEPFFTTKQNWDGKGLGLSTAYKTVQSHQGKISVQSELGRGTTFTLTFPALRRRTHLR